MLISLTVRRDAGGLRAASLCSTDAHDVTALHALQRSLSALMCSVDADCCPCVTVLEVRAWCMGLTSVPCFAGDAVHQQPLTAALA